MSKKLNNKIIVFTGGIASGKTTVKKILQEMLDKMKVPYCEISGINDLYIPFAIRNNLIEKRKKYKRFETTSLMEVIYSKYGQSLGSHLLKDFLLNKPADVIYLIDSKRNPQGIEELRKLCNHVLVLGIYADFSQRLHRYKSRQRDFDFKKGTQQDAAPLFIHEEDIFHISAAISKSDIIIENNDLLPHDIETKIFQNLVKKKFISQNFDCNLISLPVQKGGIAIKKRVLQSNEIPILLDKFYSKNKEKNIFIIQGGNRYMGSYLNSQNITNFKEIKLLDLSKIKLHVALNTLLTPLERVSVLTKQQKKVIKRHFYKLTKQKQIFINKIINKEGFDSLDIFLNYTSTGEAMRIFSNFSIPTPFSYPADDRKIKKEFKIIPKFAKKTIHGIEEKFIIKTILNSTKFYKTLTKANKKTVFIDDVFYRGRTYYAVMIITFLMDVPQNNWGFYTLCGDRVSNRIQTSRIKVLKKVLYPFENNIPSEEGYWEENNNFFQFRNLKNYHNFLSAYFDDKEKHDNIINRWSVLIEDTLKKINFSKKTLAIKELIEFYVFCTANSIKIDHSAILDQRAKNIGYCIPHIKLLLVWINQGEARWKRQIFKNKILKNMKDIDTTLFKSITLAKLVDFYKHNEKRIDLNFLNNFYSNKNGTRECEIKAEIDKNMEQKIYNTLMVNGFATLGEQLETDFVPDTKDFLCRKNNLILRFRKIKKDKKTDILLTLKIGKNNRSGFQDARELQYYFSKIQPQTFKLINEILKKTTRLTLPKKVHDFKDLNELRIFLALHGFPSLRTLVEKKRTTFYKNDKVVTFDIFPENIGKYLEIETQNPEDLKNMISLLKIPKNKIEIRDYGDIIKSKKSGLPDIEQRTCLF